MEQTIWDQRDIYWIAGIIEGEGSLYTTKRYENSLPMPRVAVQMCDEDVILKLQKITGIGRIRKMPQRNSAWKQAWTWTVASKRDVARLLLAIYPLLSARRQNKVSELLTNLSYAGDK